MNSNKTENRNMDSDDLALANAKREAEEEMEATKTGDCSLCDGVYENWGNNPYPLCRKDDHESRCCDDCNVKKVIPARLGKDYKRAVNKSRMKVARMKREVDQTLQHRRAGVAPTDKDWLGIGTRTFMEVMMARGAAGDGNTGRFTAWLEENRTRLQTTVTNYERVVRKMMKKLSEEDKAKVEETLAKFAELLTPRRHHPAGGGEE